MSGRAVQSTISRAERKYLIHLDAHDYDLPDWEDLPIEECAQWESSYPEKRDGEPDSDDELGPITRPTRATFLQTSASVTMPTRDSPQRVTGNTASTRQEVAGSSLDHRRAFIGPEIAREAATGESTSPIGAPHGFATQHEGQGDTNPLRATPRMTAPPRRTAAPRGFQPITTLPPAPAPEHLAAPAPRGPEQTGTEDFSDNGSDASASQAAGQAAVPRVQGRVGNQGPASEGTTSSTEFALEAWLPNPTPGITTGINRVKCPPCRSAKRGPCMGGTANTPCAYCAARNLTVAQCHGLVPWRKRAGRPKKPRGPRGPQGGPSHRGRDTRIAA